MPTGDPRKHRRWNEIRSRRRKMAQAREARCHYRDVVLTYDATYTPDAHTLDHLIPVSVDPGLAFSPSNIVDCCRRCNTSRQADPDWTPPSGGSVPVPHLGRTGRARRALRIARWSRRWYEPGAEMLAAYAEVWIGDERVK